MLYSEIPSRVDPNEKLKELLDNIREITGLDELIVSVELLQPKEGALRGLKIKLAKENTLNGLEITNAFCGVRKGDSVINDEFYLKSGFDQYGFIDIDGVDLHNEDNGLPSNTSDQSLHQDRGFSSPSDVFALYHGYGANVDLQRESGTQLVEFGDYAEEVIRWLRNPLNNERVEQMKKELLWVERISEIEAYLSKEYAHVKTVTGDIELQKLLILFLTQGTGTKEGNDELNDLILSKSIVNEWSKGRLKIIKDAKIVHGRKRVPQLPVLQPGVKEIGVSAINMNVLVSLENYHAFEGVEEGV